jgi:hypothetical protein
MLPGARRTSGPTLAVGRGIPQHHGSRVISEFITQVLRIPTVLVIFIAA